MLHTFTNCWRVIIDLCSSGHDCHTDAQCVFDVNEMRQKCICDLGFEGDGFSRCTPLPGKYTFFSYKPNTSYHNLFCNS